MRTSNKPPQEDDPWVEYLGKVAMSDKDYINIVHHINQGLKLMTLTKNVNSANYIISWKDYR